MTEKLRKELGEAERICGFEPPCDGQENGSRQEVPDPIVEVGFPVFGFGLHVQHVDRNPANDNGWGAFSLQSYVSDRFAERVNETFLFQACLSLSLGARAAFAMQWAFDVGDMAGFCESDPLTDILALQRVLYDLLQTAARLGIPVSLDGWVEPVDDPMNALRQVQLIATQLMSLPEFHSAAGSADVTVH
jgi:hypothetical protein